MPRVIKFRAWDPSLTRMIPWESMASWVMTAVENPNVMQFTGAKDSNGKDIYFGDVIDAIADDDCKEHSGKKFVVWSNDLAVALADELSHGFGLSPTWTGWADLRVRGNIYENPELLK